MLFDEGDFARSATLLEEALTLHDDPALHHNLARALQELGRWQDARDEYARYLEGAPDTPQRARIEARIALLDARIAEAEAEPEPIDVPAVAESAIPSRGIEAAPWVVSGIGAASLLVATVFAVLFDREVGIARVASDHVTAVPHAMAAEQYAITADVLFAAGGLSLFIGVVWGIVDLGEVSAQSTAGAVGEPYQLRF